MKRIAFHIFFALVIAAAAMSAINFFIESHLRKQREDIFGKLNEIFSGSEKYDVLFIGSSRTLVQVNPRIMDYVLQANTFNAGLDATIIPEYKMVLQSYLENHPAPQLVVMNADWTTFDVTDTTCFFNYPYYFPFLERKYVKPAISEFVPPMKLITVFPFLRTCYYNDFKKLMAVKACLFPEGRKKNILYKGYNPQGKRWKEQPPPPVTKVNYTEKGMTIFSELMAVCKARNIKVALVFPPQTNEFTSQVKNFTAFQNHILQACNKENAAFYDFTNLQGFENKKYYYNHLHLNSSGADKFSFALAAGLKKIYKK